MMLYLVVAGRTPPPEGFRPVKPGGRRLLVSPDAAAAEAAARLWPGLPAELEPLLAEPTLRALEDAPALLPRFLRLRLAQRPADRRAAAAQADALLDKLAETGRDSLLVTHPSLAAALMDRARLRGCVSQRSGLGAVRPWELILISRRTDHCGGCDHNCLLSNPGCSIGRDKAARKSG